MKEENEIGRGEKYRVLIPSKIIDRISIGNLTCRNANGIADIYCFTPSSFLSKIIDENYLLAFSSVNQDEVFSVGICFVFFQFSSNDQSFLKVIFLH